MSDRGRPPTPAVLEGIASETALSAATLIGDAGARPIPVASKTSPTDVVTQTDLDAETLIRRRLGEQTPGAGIIGEEGEGTAPGAELQWVVDPLDGTVNFLYGVPLFAVSIAAAIDGTVVAGAVVDVLRGELFSASAGGGARLGGRTIAVSSCRALDQALVATGFSYRAEVRVPQGAVAHRVVVQARDLRCIGSTALELCWVACGRLDAYYQRDTAIWDRAAGALIASEAGARTELPCPENDDLILSTTPAIYEELRSVVLSSSVSSF